MGLNCEIGLTLGLKIIHIDPFGIMKKKQILYGTTKHYHPDVFSHL